MKSKMAYAHGALALILYIFIYWTPSSSSIGSGSLGLYGYGNHHIDDGVSIALEIKRRFQNSGINSFLSILEEVVQLRDKQIILMCIIDQFGLCGGIGDRIKGIPYAVALARISDRQLILHPSLLANGPFLKNLTLESHYYHFIDGSCTKENVENLRETDAETIFITVNCEPLDPSIFSLQHTQHITLQTIKEECSISYLCGAAAIHQTEVFRDGLDIARRLVAAMPMLQYRNYTALHVRAGGSKLTIDSDYTTKALWWEDGYASGVPQNWIDVFKEAASSIQCDKHLAIVSDSVRVVSELQFAAGDRLMITRCCSQPLHRDRTHRQEFFLQEIIDLFILAQSRKIIAGYGGFAVLGRYWLGRDGPEMEVVKSKEEIQRQMESIWWESDCARRK